MLKRLLIVIFVVILFSCSSKEDNFSKYLKKVRNFNNYEFDKESKLIDRVVEAPDFVMDYLIEFDNRPDYKNYELNELEKKIVRENLSLIPEEYKTILNDRLLGIYFIEDFWGSGLCSYAVKDKNEIYTIVFLNPDLLNMTLNEAFLYKERSCFYINEDEGYDIKVDISDKYSGILYILLHEFTHAMDYVKGLTPYADPSLLNYRVLNDKSFEAKKFWNDYNKVRKEYDFPIFEKITFYGFNNGPKINLEQARYLYKTLDKTPFVSLYSTFSWAEDLAELKTISYLTNELKCNYQINVLKGKEVIYTFNPLNNKKVLERL